jgi:hypothetical protein
VYHKYGRKHSFHWLYFTCLYPQLWTLKIYASLHHHLIMVTSITQILHPLHSLALLLSLFLTLKRLHNHGTLAMALGLKSTNYSRSPGSHVTFFQTLSLSLYHLLLSSSQTLKKSPLKSSLPYASLPYAYTNIIPRTWTIHIISAFKSKQLSFLRYHTLK